MALQYCVGAGNMNWSMNGNINRVWVIGVWFALLRGSLTAVYGLCLRELSVMTRSSSSIKPINISNIQHYNNINR